ncbi:flagellar formation protein [Clostridium septicum]|nr:flagellar formation protein [Clostridium septicum]QAS62220.1 flagellar formation protein [Clostridium septicum]
MCVRLILSLVIVLGVMYLTFKVSGDRINRINRKNYIKVLERSQVSKDNFIVILKVGSKGYVMSSSNGKMEKLQDLSEEEILSIENKKLEEQNQLNEGYENIINKFKLIFNKYNKKNIR